jgi:uncharacterized protein RhaS with RHS repeats
VYFGRRFYDPITPTWLTKDPLGASAGPNLYAYAKNNPLTLLDLSGLEEQAVDDSGLERIEEAPMCASFS